MARSVASAMLEHPILFTGAMVRAILDGRKTQTRRPIRNDWLRCLDPEEDEDRATARDGCRYGKPGDRLWVRETFKLWDRSFEEVTVEYRAGGDDRIALLGSSNKPANLHTHPKRPDWPYASRSNPKWRSSIHMPRWASRLTLEVTSVRVERVQAIRETDAKAEGFAGDFSRGRTMKQSPGSQFRDLWRDTYAKCGLGWDANPWVWVVSFRPVDTILA